MPTKKSQEKVLKEKILWLAQQAETTGYILMTDDTCMGLDAALWAVEHPEEATPPGVWSYHTGYTKRTKR